ILKYNNSTSYALAISLLAERFQGRGQVLASWPVDDDPLSRAERVELQERLQQQGFEPGAADGIIGANTRQAIRRSQIALGWPADGYPDRQLLKALRNRVQRGVVHNIQLFRDSRKRIRFFPMATGSMFWTLSLPEHMR